MNFVKIGPFSVTRTKNVCRSKPSGLPKALCEETTKSSGDSGEPTDRKSEAKAKATALLSPQAPRKDLEKVYRRNQTEKQFRASWLSVHDRSMRSSASFMGNKVPLSESELKLMASDAMGNAHRRKGKKVKFDRLARDALIDGAMAFQRALVDRSCQLASGTERLDPGEANFFWKGFELGAHFNDLSSASESSSSSSDE